LIYQVGVRLAVNYEAVFIALIIVNHAPIV